MPHPSYPAELLTLLNEIYGEEKVRRSTDKEGYIWMDPEPGPPCMCAAVRDITWGTTGDNEPWEEEVFWSRIDIDYVEEEEEDSPSWTFMWYGYNWHLLCLEYDLSQKAWDAQLYRLLAPHFFLPPLIEDRR